MGKLASSDALDGSLARRHQDGSLDQVSIFSLPHLPPPPWLDAALLLDGWMGNMGCAGDSNPSPASRAHSQCSDRGVPGLLSVWFELVAGLREPGLISGFIAQPGACKMVTFYRFLAFSFFLVSVTFSSFPYCFKFLPHATKMQGLPQSCWDTFKSPLVPMPLTSLQDPTLCHKPRTHGSLLQGRACRETGLCVSPLPHLMHNAPPHLHFSGWHNG